ncbi:hypothetical protein CK203_011084 [Vitis vinifera]|uniref:Uncharacterized protein n=1 Tax=Vitis vinifera TaxID=29760 RepID=A0A438JIX4_VITVI|nr:hypothetical protein CK203_011084 [Vitis vinifera]
MEGADVGGSSLGRLKITDEALLDEASRYPLCHKLSLVSLGLGFSSSSPFFLGPGVSVMGIEGASNGSVGSTEEARSRVPLHDELIEDFSAHKGQNKPLWASLGAASGSKLAIVPYRSGFESPLAERMALQLEEGERDEGWSSSCLVKFSRCLGMPTEGFEEEILYLLRRMKGRIEQKSQNGACRKTKSSASKSSRELKKLKWTVSYKRARVVTNAGMSGGTSGSGCK